MSKTKVPCYDNLDSGDNVTDLEKIKDQDSWPIWPILPLKRKDNSLQNKNLGFLHVQTPLVIYHAYIFDLPATLEGVPQTKYESIEALLADGWRVD